MAFSLLSMGLLDLEFAAGGVLERSRKGRRGALFNVGGPWGVELVLDNDLETVHFSISACVKGKYILGICYSALYTT